MIAAEREMLKVLSHGIQSQLVYSQIQYCIKQKADLTNRKGAIEGKKERDILGWDVGGRRIGSEQGKEREKHIRLGCRREKNRMGARVGKRETY